MEYYTRISGGFRLGSVLWRGGVYVSPDAIYFHMLKESTSGFAMRGASGGAVGAVIGLAIDAGIRAFKKPPNYPPHAYPMEALSYHVTQDSQWPYKKYSSGYLIVLTKNDVNKVVHRAWGNEIIVHTDYMRYETGYLVFRGNTIKQAFIAYGWPLMWRKEMFGEWRARG